jgi:hypothetical protein
MLSLNKIQVTNTANGHTKADIFQQRTAGFEATLNMHGKREVRQHEISVYMGNVDSISLKHECNCEVREGKKIEMDTNLRWMHSSPLVSVGVVDSRIPRCLLTFFYVATLCCVNHYR